MVDFGSLMNMAKSGAKKLVEGTERENILKFKEIITLRAGGHGNYLSHEEQSRLLEDAITPPPKGSLHLTMANARNALEEECRAKNIALEQEVRESIERELRELLKEYGHLDRSKCRVAVSMIQRQHHISEQIAKKVCDDVIDRAGFVILPASDITPVVASPVRPEPAPAALTEAAPRSLPEKRKEPEQGGGSQDTDDDEEDDEIPDINAARLEQYISLYSKDALSGLCSELGLASSGNKASLTKSIIQYAEQSTADDESKQFILDTMVSDIGNCYKDDLKGFCEALDLDSSGKVDDIKVRILEYLFSSDDDDADSGDDDKTEECSLEQDSFATFLGEFESKEDLVSLCEAMGLTKSGTVAVLRKRVSEFAETADAGELKELMSEYLGNCYKDFLKQLCGAFELPVSGNVSDLKDRVLSQMFGEVGG